MENGKLKVENAKVRGQWSEAGDQGKQWQVAVAGTTSREPKGDMSLRGGVREHCWTTN